MKRIHDPWKPSSVSKVTIFTGACARDILSLGLFYYSPRSFVVTRYCKFATENYNFFGYYAQLDLCLLMLTVYTYKIVRLACTV